MVVSTHDFCCSSNIIFTYSSILSGVKVESVEETKTSPVQMKLLGESRMKLLREKLEVSKVESLKKLPEMSGKESLRKELEISCVGLEASGESETSTKCSSMYEVMSDEATASLVGKIIDG